MCSRYELAALAAGVQERFGALPPAMPNKAEVRPTDIGLIIGPDGAHIQPWGLKTGWGGGPLINARCETLHQKPSFKGLLNRRILVPASHWWEWTRDKQDKPDLKMRLAPIDGTLFAFAGLTDGERYTIITCDAVDTMLSMNDRMPVILSAQDEGAWLDPSQPYDAVQDLLKPYAAPLTVMADDKDDPQMTLF